MGDWAMIRNGVQDRTGAIERVQGRRLVVIAENSSSHGKQLIFNKCACFLLGF
jgi:hypothetical protein